MNKTVAIAGMGWLGLPFAYRLATLGYTVKGSVTSIEKVLTLQNNGFDTYLVEISEDGVKGETQGLLKNSDYLVIMIPSGLRKNAGANYVLKMTHLLEEIMKASIKKIILVSSISVYDDSQGNVTEKDDPKPKTVSGKQLRQVEELFLNSEGLQATLVRFGGLFGGNRQLVKYLAGRKDLFGGNALVNLIEREDCINILFKIIKQDAFGYIFNAVNPHHPKKSNYYIEKAKTLSLEPPTFTKTDSNKIFKQVDSENLKEVLGYAFLEGLS